MPPRNQATDTDLYLVCDGCEEVACSRSRPVMSVASLMFAAMLTGSFTESDQEHALVAHTYVAALKCLVHYLYGCQPDTCPHYEQLTADMLLELVTLSDKYLLTEVNLSACHAILRHCGNPRYLPQIYRAAVQCNYPVNCAGRLVSSVITIHKQGVCSKTNSVFRSDPLSSSVVKYLLVVTMSNTARVELVTALVSCDLASHLLDDISKLLRQKLDPAAVQ